MFPLQAQRVGRGIALLFHDRGTRSGWVVSSTLRPYLTPRKDPVPSVQEDGWAVHRAGLDRRKISPLTGFDLRTVQPVVQSLFRLNYRAHYTRRLCCKISVANIPVEFRILSVINGIYGRLKISLVSPWIKHRGLGCVFLGWWFWNKNKRYDISAVKSEFFLSQ